LGELTCYIFVNFYFSELLSYKICWSAVQECMEN